MDNNSAPQNTDPPVIPPQTPPIPPAPQVSPPQTPPSPPAAPQVIPPAPPAQQTAVPTSPKPTGSKALLYGIVALVILLAAGAGGYFLLHKNNSSVKNSKVSQNQTKAAKNQSAGTTGSPSDLATSINQGMQQKARDSKREADIRSLQTQLEAYFSQNGYYPTLTDMNNSSWLASNMQSLDTSSLSDPSSPTNSMQLAAVPTKGQYAYQVTDSSGKSCENNATNCAKYTLTAELETAVNGSNIFSVQNLD